MNLRDIIPWSLIWGVQNGRHARELERGALFGLTPADSEWMTACNVAKLLPRQKYSQRSHDMKRKPSAKFLAGMKKAGLLVAPLRRLGADNQAFSWGVRRV